MKSFNFLPVLTSLSLLAASAPVQASSPIPTWLDLHRMVEHCAVEIVHPFVDGRSLDEPLTSTCSSLRKINDTTVEFDLHRALYRAVISESPLSDGGDLQDLAIYALPSKADQAPSATPVLEAQAILAFGDPILALALGQTDGIRTQVGDALKTAPHFAQ